MHKIFFAGLVSLLFLQNVWSIDSIDGIWTDATIIRIHTPTTELISLTDFRLVDLNGKALIGILDKMRQRSAGSNTPPIQLSVPMPDGTYQSFAIIPSNVMAPDLSAKFPEIYAFAGAGIDEPSAWGRFDWSPSGFHGFIQVNGETIYINPHDIELNQYIVFRKSDLNRPAPDFVRQRSTDVIIPEGYVERQGKTVSRIRSTGTQQRTYRLAVAATGEYTATHGGTVEGGQAAIVTAINRVDGIYAQEFSTRLQLVDNNSSLVYIDGTTDPFTDNDSFALIAEVPTVINNTIGSGNYDIGHVFSTGGGGLAGLGVACGSFKSEGVTGSPSPTGDPFWVDYVAHEIGHQLNGNHSFNGVTGACNARNATTAYEPGSGSTIMAYAGICDSDDLQFNSDAYMHAVSLGEISTFVFSGNGSNCGTVAPTGNNIPIVSVSNSGLILPISTPFTLTGSATDADNDTLTYNWEQYDLDSAIALGSASGNSPLMRSYPAVTSPSRTIPNWTDLLENKTSSAELLPTYARNLVFRLTVRDAKGGVNFADASYAVDANSGPFVLTSPNGSESLNGGVSTTVTWNTANTDVSPVNCTLVNILLSTDSGVSFSTTLLSATPNDGSQSVILANVTSATARLMVACANNIFFDVSNADFSITSGISCSGGDVTVDSSTSFPTAMTTTCTATSSIVTSGSVTIPANATVVFQAPSIQLNGGFTAENGSAFQAKQ